MNTKACIVTTLRGVSPLVIQTFITYHLSIGFQHIYLFYDEQREVLNQDNPCDQVTIIRHNAKLKQRWKQAHCFKEYEVHVEKEVMARQILNTEIAISMAIDRGYDWILHIDIDELFVLKGHKTIPEHFQWLEKRGSNVVNYFNHEAIPESYNISNYFKEVKLFKRNIYALSKEQKEDLKKILGSHKGYFKFYKNGKSAAKLHRHLVPIGVHTFCGEMKKHIETQTSILHYPCCGLNYFLDKYKVLGDFSDKWFGSDTIADKLPTHVLSREIVRTNDMDLIRRFYNIVFLSQGNDLVDTLIEKDIYFRVDSLLN